jgi:hypothetical protein
MEERPDLLIDEVREIRRRISERFDNDIDKLCDHLQEIEKQHPEKLMHRNPDTGGLEPVHSS